MFYLPAKQLFVNFFHITIWKYRFLPFIFVTVL